MATAIVWIRREQLGRRILLTPVTGGRRAPLIHNVPYVWIALQ